MRVYLLTNKVTHASAVVIAASAEEARRVHPTCDSAHRRERDWFRYRGGTTLVSVPPPTGWPRDLSLIHADEIASHVVQTWDGCAQALCYQSSTDLRRGGPIPEGPDQSWGGYTLARLAEALDPL